ncbi:MAG: preprotein translocase subunit YajC [Oscillospiraceae bacterium]|jgi:preprotein translocase subunit YajC|nr:preprotein translocase subunit YajC [Oscillospiraceae bacterium]
MNFIPLAETAGSGSMWQMLLIMGGMFVVMYFVMIRPQRKRQKEEEAMRSNVEVGDEITTIGGIIGRVVTVKEDVIIVETGADRAKVKFARWAVSVNNTANEKLQKEREEAKSAREKELQEKADAKKKRK